MHSLANDFMRTPHNKTCFQTITQTSNKFLPSDEQLPDVLELGYRKAFGEDVGLLLLGVDVLCDDPLFFADLRPKEVILQSEILVARGHLGHIHQTNNLGYLQTQWTSPNLF